MSLDPDLRALAGFDELVTSTLEQWAVPGIAVAVVRGDRAVYERGFGRRRTGEAPVVTPDTIFPIASCSKAVAAVALGTIVDQGLLAWNEPIEAYLPGIQFATPGLARILTLDDLLSHRTGIPIHHGLWFNNQSLARDELLARLPHLELSAAPRERWQYSNLMYALAAQIAEVVTGTPWDELLRERVLDPLGSDNWALSVSEARARPESAYPHRIVEGVAVGMPDREIGAYGAAGGVLASARGLSNWMSFNLSGGRAGERTILREETLAVIHAPHHFFAGQETDTAYAGYAFGWVVTRGEDGHRVLGHDGGASGSTSIVTLYPEDGLGIAILINSEGDGRGIPLLSVLTEHVADRMLGRPARDWNAEAFARYAQAPTAAAPATIPAVPTDEGSTPERPLRPLPSYAATYRHAGYGDVRIEVSDAGLVAVHNLGAPVGEQHREPLEHVSGDTFAAAEGTHPLLGRGTVYGFVDETGEVPFGLVIPFEPAVAPIRFDRVD